LALRPLEIDRPPDKAGGGDIRWPPALALTTRRKNKELAKHRAERYKRPPEWRWRGIRNRWYAFIKPDLKARYRALQSVTRQNVQNYIKKLR
jgi:hypothetical protein